MSTALGLAESADRSCSIVRLRRLPPSSFRGEFGMRSVYGAVAGGFPRGQGLLVLGLGVFALLLPGIFDQSIPEEDGEAGEDRPFGGIEDVEPVDRGLLDGWRRVDGVEARGRRAVLNEVRAVDVGVADAVPTVH